MPKIKPTTLFCKRTLPILLVDDSKPDSLMKAAMLVQPVVDELVKQVPKVNPDVVHVKETGNPVYNAMNTIEALLSISQPTIVVAPGIDPGVRNADGSISETAEALASYIRFLVSAGGGFIIHLESKEGEHDLNAALPILHFNAESDSYMDIEYKVSNLVKKLASPGNIGHAMTIQSVANSPWPKNKLALVLGSWGRGMWDEEEGKGLTHIINVKGVAGSPITPEEYVSKIWCNGVDHKALTPANALIVRNPSIESKLVLAKLLSTKKQVKGITFIEA